MIISFAQITIAQEFSDGGSDAVEGFGKPKGSAGVQWKTPIRAKDATPLPLFNRKQFISGTITQKPSDTLADAMLARGLFFTTVLGASGALVFTIGTIELIYQSAVLTDYEAIKEEGVTVGFSLTFAVGPPQQGNVPILGENGSVIEGENGTPILAE